MSGKFLRLMPDQVAVSERLRAIDPDEVRKMAVSMRDVGQLTPIEVGEPLPDGRYPLIAGAHRLEASILAELPFLEAWLFEGSPDMAELHEIDENLYRRELSPYDQAAFLAKRIALLERMHGKVRSGRPRKNNSANLPNIPNRNYLRETSDQFGLPLRDIRRALARHRNIDPAVWKALRGTPWIKTASTLDAIAKLDPKKQLAMVQALVEGRVRTVRAALALVVGGKAQAQVSAKKQFDRLVAMWRRTGAAARRQFIEHIEKSDGTDDAA